MQVNGEQCILTHAAATVKRLWHRADFIIRRMNGLFLSTTSNEQRTVGTAEWHVLFFCLFVFSHCYATCLSLLEIIVQRYLEEALTQFVFFKSRWKYDTSQRTGVLWLIRDHTCTVYVKVWNHIPYIMIFNKPVRAWLHSRLTNWTC